tara:strand:+ start:7041 stop:7724 length:684 start_codon:yes stop_codon:yes gene_type:complete
MSSNTTFSSQGNFNRPEIIKLEPQKNIVNIIILCSTFILLLIPFIDSISHKFGGNFKYNAPSYFSIYVIVVSAIFIFSLINILKNFNKIWKNDKYTRIASKCSNISFIAGVIAFIIMISEINNNINYIKNKLWDFSGVNTNTEKKRQLDLCITAYFGDGKWIGISIYTFIISICILLCFKLPDNDVFKILLSFVVLVLTILMYLCNYEPWYRDTFKKKQALTCPTKE